MTDESDFMDEGQAAELKRTLPGIQHLPRHPVFEIAEQTPVFLVGDKVYSLGEGAPNDGGNFYEQTEGVLNKLVGRAKLPRTPLVEIGDFFSLEALMLNRAQPDLEKTGEAYIREAKRDLNVLKTLDGDLDTPQLIFTQVFPYLQDGHYKDRVSELLGLEEKRDVAPRHQIKAKVTPRLEQIADGIGVEVNRLIEQIGGEGREPAKKTGKQLKLDNLLGYEYPKPGAGSSLLGKALNRNNIAIVEGAVYDLIAETDGYNRHVQIGGQRFSLVKRNPAKRKPKTDFEVGDQIRMNAGASLEYNLTKKGSKGVIKRDCGNGVFGVEFTKLTGIEQDMIVPVIYDVCQKYMENLSEIAAENMKTPGDLEDRFLAELGRQVRVDALRQHLSRDKVIDLLRTQHAELLEMAGVREFQGNGFGFTRDEGGDYYAYIEVPAFAIKSQFDGNYYLFDKSRIGIRVWKRGNGLSYGNNLVAIDNNNHPFLHNQKENFASFCIGYLELPTSEDHEGEVIAKRLRRGREMAMFGYARDDYHHHFQLREDIGFFRKNLTSLKKLKEMGVPIIEGGRRG